MRRKAEKTGEGQGVGPMSALRTLVAGMARSKQELMSWVHGVGLRALAELFEAEADEVSGVKGRHDSSRTHHRWGKTSTSLPFGGRRITMKRPRLRTKDGQEHRSRVLSEFRAADVLPDRVLEQMILGVSTRGYQASLEPVESMGPSRGVSKSSAARQLKRRMRQTLEASLSERLEGVKLVAMMLDGIALGKGMIVVALGITEDGQKKRLGFWQGTTENTATCTGLLQNLFARGLTIDEPILCVIDGGKAIRRALEETLGERAVVQRCQVHKKRNVLDQLPKAAHGNVKRLLTEAYRGANVTLARKRLKSLASWLDGEGHSGAAASLREGQEETLTVLALELPESLRRSLSSTNAIENMMGTVRRLTRNVKRWQKGKMVERWIATGLKEAERRFRKINAHRELPKLHAALAKRQTILDRKVEAA